MAISNASPWGSAFFEAFSTTHSGIALSKIPVLFSSCKIPSGNAYISLRTFSAFILQTKGPGGDLPARIHVDSKSSCRFEEFPPRKWEPNSKE
jgi:hypothetical protein